MVRNSDFWISDTEQWSVKTLLTEERGAHVLELNEWAREKHEGPCGDQGSDQREVGAERDRRGALPSRGEDSLFASSLVDEAVEKDDVVKWVKVRLQIRASALSSVSKLPPFYIFFLVQNHAHPVVVGRGTVRLLDVLGVQLVAPEVVMESCVWLLHLGQKLGESESSLLC